MKRKPKPWTKDELGLLGKLPDAEAAVLSGRSFGILWQKRRAGFMSLTFLGTRGEIDIAVI